MLIKSYVHRSAILPVDTLVFIMQYLPTLQDVARIAQVNRACRAAVMSPKFSYEIKTLMYDFGHTADELPILRPRYVRGTHAQLREFFETYHPDQQRLDKLNRTPYINNPVEANNFTGVMCFASSVTGIIFLGLGAGLSPFMKNIQQLKTVWSILGIFASPFLVISPASGAILCLRKFASRRSEERDVVIQRLHHNSLFAPQEFGVTVSFEPTQEHVEAAAPARVEMM